MEWGFYSGVGRLLLVEENYILGLVVVVVEWLACSVTPAVRYSF